jgi:uncharacterized protein with HEPN domain
MQRDEQYLIDILESAKMAMHYINDLSWDDFLNDVRTQDAIIRRFAVIGEAARRVSNETQSKYLDLPWREMIGMRNLAIHEYDAIDFEIVWNTVHKNLPALIESLNSIIK